ncbi:MAG: ATP-binding protein [Polyangiales bacterium]
MTPFDAWQERNAAYLGAALSWVRLRLQLRALPHQIAAAQPATSAPARGKKARTSLFNRGSGAPPTETRPLLGAPATVVDRARVDEAAAEVARRAHGTPPPALLLLAERLQLSPFERDVLLLGAAVELDTGVAALCAAAQGDRDRPFLTFALALTTLDDPSWDALSPSRPLRRLHLLEIEHTRGVALTASALRIDERIVSFLKGLDFVDERLAPMLSAAPADADSLADSQHALADALAARMRASRGGPFPVLHLTGNTQAARRHVAGAACAALGLRMLRLNADMLPSHPADLELAAQLWRREYLLTPVALYVENGGATRAGEHEGSAARATRFMQRTDGVLFVDDCEAVASALAHAITFDVARPTAAEQASAWRGALGDDGDALAPLLTGQFNLNLADIRALGTQAAPADRGSRVWEACLLHTRPAFAGLAQKLPALATWDDIVLPPQETALLRHLATQVRQRAQVYDGWGFRERMNRGLGITALFAGESGTGKTMAAEVLANALHLDLHRIDLSAVVSKYIGETEKNLSKVFDAAEQGGTILFFDEADALFGKRSEVKDAHDRYANIEVNYLLQRMEAFTGLAILASNLKSALDPAFVRRIRFIVNFPYPAARERQEIWQRAFPPGVPRTELDCARLGKLNLTGGNIHNIALNAAFRAAEDGTAVTMPAVLEAVRMELRKLERPINDADLRWEPRGVGA